MARRRVTDRWALAGIALALFLAPVLSTAGDARGSTIEPARIGTLCGTVRAPHYYAPKCLLVRATPIVPLKSAGTRGEPGDVEPEPEDECARAWAGNTRGKPATRPSCR